MRQDAAQFEKDSKAIHDGFTSLQIDFGAFTGSFESWAQGEENKHAKDIEDLGKEIAALEKEISDIKGKMALWGGIGAVGTVGATVGLVLLLGPVGLVSSTVSRPGGMYDELTAAARGPHWRRSHDRFHGPLEQ